MDTFYSPAPTVQHRAGLLPAALSAATDSRLSASTSGPGTSGTSSSERDTESPPLRTLRILIVDDDDICCKMLAAYLAAMNQKVETVNNGAGALTLLSKRRFDIIFLDLHMPGMNGVETMQAFRKLRGSHNRVAIIGLTADSQRQAMVKCLASGMDEFLSKPVNQTDLRHIIKRWQNIKAA